MKFLAGKATRMHAGVLERVRRRDVGGDPERGDVPGWVLVTLMSAGLVSALWFVAEPALAGLLGSALDSVTGP